MNQSAQMMNESSSSKREDSINNKSLQERMFSNFASAARKLHMSNVLVIDKLSIIVKKYFESIPLIKKQAEEVDILIQYNKKLIEILGTFEEQETKLITRLRRLEEMNLEYMREYCILKGKPVKLPKLNEYESVFAHFNLNHLKFEPKSH